MDKKVVLALGLSLFILIGFQLIMSKLYPQQTIAPMATRIQTAAVNNLKAEKEIEKETELPAKTDLPDEEEIIFTNRLYTMTFSDVGAGIKNIVLNTNTSSGLNVEYNIFSVKDHSRNLFLFAPNKFGFALNNAKYNSKQTNDGVVFTANISNELWVEKRFKVHNSLYLIELETIIRNLKSNDIAGEYSIVSGIAAAGLGMDERFLEISSDLDGKVARHKKQRNPFEIKRIGNLNWVIVKNRYFSMISRPLDHSYGYTVQQFKDGTIATSINFKYSIIPANSSVNYKIGLYLGPSDLGLVKAANINVETALSAGIFGGISQLLISLLKFFHKVVRNWGVAIILLTIFINIVLLPLTKKSYKSMHEMQVLQPKMEKLRQEFKNNPQKLQKEIMELYKKYKINPMAGCLPMILQMPIFIALYQGLMHSIELRGARFIWINDLSTPENIKIPFTLPMLGNSINILPIFMLVAMFIQQRLSGKAAAMAQTDEQRQQQKMMSVMMSIMFGFIFYNFPSGLVLYWFANTLIMVAYQLFFTKAHIHTHTEAYA